MIKDVQVYGESARAILDALTGTEPTIDPDGMYQFNWTLKPDEAGPVARAITRAEAALLLADAGSCDIISEARTPEQRRADALVEVVTAAAHGLRLGPAAA